MQFPWRPLGGAGIALCLEPGASGELTSLGRASREEEGPSSVTEDPGVAAPSWEVRCGLTPARVPTKAFCLLSRNFSPQGFASRRAGSKATHGLGHRCSGTRVKGGGGAERGEGGGGRLQRELRRPKVVSGQGQTCGSLLGLLVSQPAASWSWGSPAGAGAGLGGSAGRGEPRGGEGGRVAERSRQGPGPLA